MSWSWQYQWVLFLVTCLNKFIKFWSICFGGVNILGNGKNSLDFFSSIIIILVYGFQRVMDFCIVEMNGYFVKKGKENVYKIINELCISCLISQIVEGVGVVMIDFFVVQGVSC